MEESRSDNPYYKELSRYPVRFARAVFLGQLPPFSDSLVMASATMTLIKFDDLFIGVTCQHVLAHYVKMREDHEDIVFQIGQAQFDPLQHLIHEDRERDLATFNLTPFVGKVKGVEESNFIEPLYWPPGDVLEDDLICLAGFPGIWREQLGLSELRFHSFSTGATFIRAVGDEHFVIRINAEPHIVTIDKGKALGFLGGLSGGPVFCWRTRGLLWAELVGFIYEYQENLDLMYVRAAKVLNRDGTFA
ncbi:MAG TPA: hypothetical protein VF656_20650 [Pyrinomonadaceae bacterium]|jgi:hypothetical protein